MHQEGRSYSPLVCVVGSGNLISGFEESLLSAKADEDISVEIAPADAYGDKDPDQIETISIDKLLRHVRDPKSLYIGGPVSIEGRQGTLSYLAAASEIVGSWSLIIGLGTRFGASAILGTMSVAIYHALVTSGFNIYLLELLALYFSSAISIILLGPGKFSADYIIDEFFIKQLNPIETTSRNKTNLKAKANNIKNLTSKPKQDKFFEFPFSSFLSS